MTTMEEALAALDPRIRKRLTNGVGFKTEFQGTPSYGLNRALNGGFPMGRQILFGEVNPLPNPLYAYR
jgi:hypothetical protein